MISVNNYKTAINVLTGLDRIKLRVEFFDSNKQNEMITALDFLKKE